MGENLRNLTVRALSGAVLAVVVLLAVVWSQWSFAALLAAVLTAGMLEFYALAEKRGERPQRTIGLLAGLALFLLGCILEPATFWIPAPLGERLQGVLTAIVLLSVPAVLVCELFRRNGNPAASAGTTLLGVLYVALPLTLMYRFPVMDDGSWGPGLMLAYIFIIWANDVFAYLVGMSVGRHKLFERLSPKKSWEGFFGGLAGAVAAGIVSAYLMHGSMWAWAGLAFIASVTGVLGDLVESMLKRSAGVKDSGRLIPGHGGMLDRFDAMLLSAPFVFVYMRFVM